MKKLFLGLVVLSTMMLFSCNKEDNGIFSNEDEAIASNDAAAESAIESSDYEVDLFTGSEESINGSSSLKSTDESLFGGRYHFGKTPLITIETTDGGFPKTITVNYGDGVELTNGTTISGSIVIVVSAKPRSNGAVRTVTYNNFYIDSVNIAGNRTWTFSISDQNGVVNTCVGEIVITFPDGTYINREIEKTRTFIAGFDTPIDFSDDIIHIEGFTNSVSSEGFTFSSTIIEPLVRTGECRFIVQGIVSMSKNDAAFAELDYGDGTCDDVATITKDGEVRQITLGKRHRIRN